MLQEENRRGQDLRGKLSGFETWRDPGQKKTWGENTDAGREVQPWEGTGVPVLHETHREKILPVTERKMGPDRCWDCVDPANVCFGDDQVEEKGQRICQGNNRCRRMGQADLGVMLKVAVFITVAEFHPDPGALCLAQ